MASFRRAKPWQNWSQRWVCSHLWPQGARYIRMLVSRTISGAILRGVLIGIASGIAMSLLISVLGWWEHGPYLIAGAVLCGGVSGFALCYPRFSSDL